MPINDITKLQDERDSILRKRQRKFLKILLIPGMEALAQELMTGQEIYSNDDIDPNYPTSPETGSQGSSVLFAGNSSLLPDPNLCAVESPTVSPCFPPYDTSSLPFLTRRRSGRFKHDASKSFPLIFIEQNKVDLCSSIDDMQDFIKRDDSNKIAINTSQIVSIQVVTVFEFYTQNKQFEDIDDLTREAPPITEPQLQIGLPSALPVLSDPSDEFILNIPTQGGQHPFEYHLMAAPTDLYVTEDGWIRGHIEEEQWPEIGETKEYLIRVAVVDSSTPEQTVVFDFRYRLSR